jgi:ribosomal protein S18 acetylase RimI-like enzyme
MQSTGNVRRLEATDWLLYSQLRLRGLAESPDAFGSTLALEQQRSAEEWQRRASNGAASSSDLPLLALVHNSPAGLAWAKADPSNPSQISLYQMWVAPEHRGMGLGRQLLQTAISWARARDATAVCLGVTLSNGPAMHLYLKAGFVPSGATEPLRSGSALLVQPMTLCLEEGAV